jgi:hypothetical protein
MKIFHTAVIIKISFVHRRYLHFVGNYIFSLVICVASSLGER